MKFVPFIPLLLDSGGIPQMCFPMNAYEVEDFDALELADSGLGFIEGKENESTLQIRTDQPSSKPVDLPIGRQKILESGQRRRGRCDKRTVKRSRKGS